LRTRAEQRIAAPVRVVAIHEVGGLRHLSATSAAVFDQRGWSPPRSMLIPSEPSEASPGASAVLPCVRARSFELRFSLRMPIMILAALQSTL
jgi:hypothetical protein